MLNTWNELKEIQPQVFQMLQNSLQKNRIAHAYIFEGERGTGKKDASLLLAKRLKTSRRIVVRRRVINASTVNV